MRYWYIHTYTVYNRCKTVWRRAEPREGAWMTSRLKKRPAHYHVTRATMTTASEQVVARVGKSPSKFDDSSSYHYYYYHHDDDQCAWQHVTHIQPALHPTHLFHILPHSSNINTCAWRHQWSRIPKTETKRQWIWLFYVPGARPRVATISQI